MKIIKLNSKSELHDRIMSFLLVIALAIIISKVEVARLLFDEEKYENHKAE